MKLERIRYWDSRARTNYTYKHDPDNHDNWKSYADEVLDNKAWADDCDSLASTVLDLLARDGAKLENLFRVLVSSAKNGKIDHMVAYAMDSKGDLYVVGDTFSTIYPRRGMRHQEIAVSPCTGVKWYYSKKTS